MALVAILGDTHFGARNDNLAFHKYFERFYSECFFPYLEEKNVDTIVQMGDMFDKRKFINFRSLMESRRYFFQQLVDRGLDVYMIVGNHDTAYKNTNEVNSPELLLGEYDNIKIWSSPGICELPDGSKLAMLPWICSDNYDESLEFIANAHTKAKVLIGHLELSGFEMHKGHIHQSGMSPALFSKIPQVITGHYHHVSSKDNIQYTGSPYELTWSDYNDPRGFFILDTETLDLEFIGNPFKMFHKWYYDDDQWESIEQLEELDCGSVEGTHVKVIVKSKSNPLWFDMYIKKLEEAGVEDITVVDDSLNLQLEDDVDIVDEAEDTLTILKKYSAQVNSEFVSQDKLEKVLTNLYQEANTLE